MTLPENALKEMLSRGFVRLVASHDGFVVGTDEADFGGDLNLSHVHVIAEPDNRIQYRKSGFSMEVQIKATCERNVDFAEDHLKYDLRSVNYNDLVRRRLSQIPLILVLFVLPDDPTSWLGVAESELVLRRCAYIWRPSDEDEVVDNTSSKRISIPFSNRLQLTSFQALREEFLA